MPRRPDIESICLIGSGPIVIGQACEFDYAGCQALKVLREDGFRTIVVNSNPATIMTDPGFADRTYLEPLDLEGVAGVLERERPDALLPTMGGQTALNLAVQLARRGILDDLGVELIGAPIDVIQRAEDRERFRETVRAAGPPRPGVDHRHRDRRASRRSLAARDPPARIHAGRPRRRHRTHPEELDRLLERALSESPVGQVLVEESLLGWDEFELELMRDRADNAVVVCSIENIDPMGVHTGDSVTVAPQMTLSDAAYQELRDAAIAVIRAVGVDCGGSNIQFARDRESGELRVIEMNPRVSRSSALASKATGYPIAKVAAKLAVGYTLDEIPNDLTGTTPASFEPTLDYVVVKFPRFAFEKFPGADTTLGTQMKSVGEAMGIGRTFGEAFLKARRSRELDGAQRPGPSCPRGSIPGSVPSSSGSETRVEPSRRPRRRRLARTQAARDLGCGDRDPLQDDRGDRTGEAARVGRTAGLPAGRLLRRRGRGELELLLLHLGRARRSRAERRRSRAWSFSARGRTGSARGSSSTTAASTRRRRSGRLGYEAVMVNCNPETVSTDYDTSNRLYFEPLGAEEVLEICARELPDGVVIQFGGQTPLKLAREIETEGWRILGTPFDAVDLAEDRERFGALCDELDDRGSCMGRGRRARGGRRTSPRRSATRCSYGPRTSSAAGTCRSATTSHAVAQAARPRRARPGRQLPRRSDRDRRRRALRRGGHLRRGGDGARGRGRRPLRRLVLRAAGAVARRRDDRATIEEIVCRLAPALGVVGLVNVQLAVVEGDVFVIEANPRASRTVPFASKATGVNLVEAGVPPRGGRPPVRPGPARGSDPDASQRQGGRAPVRPLPRRRPRARPGDALDGRGDGQRRRPADRPRQGRAGRRAAASDGGHCLPLRPRRRQADGDRGGGGRSPSSASASSPPPGTAHALAAAGIAVDHVRKVTEPGDGPTVVDLIRGEALRPRRQHALRQLGRPLGRVPHPGGGARGAGPVHHDDRRGAGRRPCDRGCERRPRGLAPGADRCAEEKRLSATRPTRPSGPTR